MDNSQSKQKRIRGPNYTEQDKELLLNIVSEFESIVENKKADQNTNQDKKEAWIKIAEKFNALSSNLVHRSVESLKKYYEHLKEDLRKRCAKKRSEFYKTGGGVGEGGCHTDNKDELLLSIMSKKSVYGLDSPHDCDFIDQNKEPKGTAEVLERARVGTVEYILNVDPEVEERNTQDMNTVLMEIGNINNMEVSIEDDIETSGFIEEQNNGSEHHWGKVSAQDLKRPKNKILQRNIKKVCSSGTRKDMTRRRPIVRTLTSSRLGEKYESLIEKKMEMIECQKKEHALTIESLKLDIEIKKVELNKLLQ